ncbi:MAG: hypothetical protein QXP04_00260 [Candidatus Nanoarchaeia archaeon]|nr:hypothetical protein [Candidatus Jingweiarchaeum tengchongense]
MWQEKKVIRLQAAIIVSLLIISAFLFIQNIQLSNRNVGKLKEEQHFGGYFTIVKITKDGERIVIAENVPNLVTNIGKRHVRNLLCALNNTYSSTNNITKYLSVSNDSGPSSTWTRLPNEVNANGFSRAAGTVTVINNTAYKTVYQWTATGTQQLQAVGLHWSGQALSDGNLFACASFTQTTFNSGDTLEVTYTVNVSSS